MKTTWPIPKGSKFKMGARQMLVRYPDTRKWVPLDSRELTAAQRKGTSKALAR